MARRELEECRDDYSEFVAEIDEWVLGLAKAAERGDESISLNIETLLDTVISSEADAWKRSARKWLDARTKEKIMALLAVIRKRSAPWQFKVSRASLMFLSHKAWQVHIYYEVDHVKSQIVITKYDGLPGQTIP
jgi:hypothetical protein